MTTSLVFGLLLCLCAHSSTQQCRQELLENLDFPGSDITFLYSPDAHHCQHLCTQHHSCLFFTFIRPDWTNYERHFHCYLKKTSSGEPNENIPLLGVTSGYSLKPCLQTSVTAPCFDQVYPNTDFLGATYRSLFTSNYEECQRACTMDPGCQFFTWANGVYSYRIIRYSCLLKFSWTVATPPAVTNLANVVSGFSHNAQISTSNNFVKECHSKYFPGMDVPGNNLLNMPAGSPEHCQVLCSTHPSCLYFSYEGTTCFLKNNPNEMATVAREGVTSGLPSRFCQQDKNWLNSTYAGKDFPGSDMKFVLLDDAESCQRACDEEPNCLFYTYVTASFQEPGHWRRCYMKRVITIPAPPKVNKLNNLVSGFHLRNCESSSAGGSPV